MIVISCLCYSITFQIYSEWLINLCCTFRILNGTFVSTFSNITLIQYILFWFFPRLVQPIIHFRRPSEFYSSIYDPIRILSENETNVLICMKALHTFSRLTSLFRTPRTFDMYLTSSAFASPSLGGALICTCTPSAEIPKRKTIQ